MYVCIYVCERERERARMSRGGAETEGEKETLQQAPHCQHRA